MEKILTEVFGIWYLIGAAFVFFMQAGFAMVEAGFTRAKNAGNIIMKNLMDFCLGTVAFLIVGYSFLCGSDVANGFIGWIGFDLCCWGLLENEFVSQSRHFASNSFQS